MVNLVKIGTKFINADCISSIDIEDMTIYLNSSNGLIEVNYNDDFYDSVEFKDAIIKAFNKYESGNSIFK